MFFFSVNHPPRQYQTGVAGYLMSSCGDTAEAETSADSLARGGRCPDVALGKTSYIIDLG